MILGCFPFALMTPVYPICTYIILHCCHFALLSFRSVVIPLCCYFALVSFRTGVILHWYHFALVSFHTGVILHCCHFALVSFRTAVISHWCHFALVAFRTPDSVQGILKGDWLSLYYWPPVWLVWNQLYDNWQFWFLFAKQTNPNQSNSRSMVQWYFPL